MSGSPRGKDKPRPSYEDGQLRDPEIAECLDPDYKESDLTALLRTAVQVAKRPLPD